MNKKLYLLNSLIAYIETMEYVYAKHDDIDDLKEWMGEEVRWKLFEPLKILYEIRDKIEKDGETNG